MEDQSKILSINDRDLEDALEQVQGAVDDLRNKLYYSCNRLIERGRYERQEMRNHLLGKLKDDERREFSFNVMTYRIHNGQIDLGWLRLKNTEGGRIPVRIPMKERLVHLNKLLYGVHGLERRLLTNHEMQSRTLRNIWKLSNDLLRSLHYMEEELATRRALRFEFTDEGLKARQAGSREEKETHDE